MKKILLILSFIVAFASAYSQTPESPTPGTAPRSNSSVIPEDYNLSVRSIFLLPRFVDTTSASANTKPLFDTCGRMFFNYTTNSVWVRKCNPKRWVEIASSNEIEESYYGTIYNQDSWATLDTFIATSVTASVVDGRISLSGGSSASDFTHSLDLNYQTGLDRWKILIKVVPTDKDANSFGIGIGTHATSTWAAHGFDIIAKLDLTNGGSSGVVSLQNNNGSSYVSIATSSALSFAANDTILLSLERKQDSLIAFAQDLTTGSIVAARYQYVTTSGAVPMPNTGYFSLRSFGGTQLVDSMAVTSKGIKNITTMIAGDSKAFYFASAYKNVFSNLVDHDIWSTNNTGGAAETTKDIISRLPEIQRTNPRQFILQTYSNDPRSGMTQQESFDSITSIYNTLTSYGIDVFFLPLYESAQDLLPWYYFFKANWPTRVIESYEVMQTPGLLVDGVHFSTAGQDTLSKIIINSFLLKGGNNRYSLYNTLQGVTDAGNSTTNNIGINVLNPTIPLQVVNVASAPAISGTISINSGTEVLKIENTNAGSSAATAIRFYNNGGLNSQLTLGSTTNAVNANGISFHSFSGAMRIGSNSDVFEIFTGVLGPSQANVKARMMNDGRMAIGVNPTPVTSALFEVQSTTLGFLTPRMTTTQQNAIATPASGLLIYNTDSLKHCYYTGSAWVCYGSGSGGGSQSWDDVMAVSADISTDYVSDFNNFTWQWRNTNAFTIYSDNGSTTRVKIDNSQINLFAPDGGTGYIATNDSVSIRGVDDSPVTGLDILLINPATGSLTKVAASSIVNQGLQDVISADADLTQPNTIEGGGFGFIWNNFDSYEFYANTMTVQANSIDLVPLDSLRFIGIDETATTGLGFLLINPATGTITKVDAASVSSTWNGIQSPTGDQALTFDAGESSTWTNSNTTEDLFTVNSSTVTTSSLFSLNRTSTALAAGNNIMELVSSQANGSSSITATGLSVSVTNTGTTSTNIAGRFVASGGTNNYAISTTGTYIGNDFNIATAGITTPAMAVRSTTNDVTGGIVLANNANYAQFLYLSAGQIQATLDMRFDVIGGDLTINSAQTFMGGTTDPTAKIHIAAGTTGAGTAPLKFTSGTNMTTAETGAMEYNGTNLFFTRTGTTRETVLVGDDGGSAPATNTIGLIADYYGTSATRVLTTPDSWLAVVIDGTTYRIPLYVP